MSPEAWFWWAYGVIAVMGVLIGLGTILSNKSPQDKREDERFGAQIVCASVVWPLTLLVAFVYGVSWLLITAFGKED